MKSKFGESIIRFEIYNLIIHSLKYSDNFIVKDIKHSKSLNLMLFLICLSDDPSNKTSGFLSGTGKKFKWYHIKHLYCLIYLVI